MSSSATSLPGALPAPREGARAHLGVSQYLIVLSVMCAVLLEIIDTSIVNVALPSMMGNLGATLDEIDWVVTGYIVANVIVIPMTGWLAGRFGRTRYFVTSILVFTFASLMCGASQSIDALVFWRVIQGLGGGALLATSQTILMETFPPGRQGMAQALFGVGTMVGPSLGPTLGGFITDHWSWHWVFLINVPLGLVAAALCATQLRDPPYLKAQRTPVVDWPGIALLVVSIGALQWLLERGHKDGWFASGKVTALALVTVLGVVALVIRELNTDHPVVDLRVLRQRPLVVGCFLGAVVTGGLYGCIFLFPVYTQSLLGWPAWNSGLAVLPSSITTAIVMLIAGRLVYRLGPRRMVRAGLCAMIASLFGMHAWSLQSGWDQLFWPQILRGIAMGLSMGSLSLATLRSMAPEDVPKAAGLFNLFRQLGGSFGISVLSTLLDQRADVHRVGLAAGVGPLEPGTVAGLARITESLTAAGLPPEAAQAGATAVLARSLEAHAQIAAFQDAYLALIALFLVALPATWFVVRRVPGMPGR
jgi:DHA2 family multidrug resistance protein